MPVKGKRKRKNKRINPLDFFSGKASESEKERDRKRGKAKRDFGKNRKHKKHGWIPF